jgi:hypothetical protein
VKKRKKVVVSGVFGLWSGVFVGWARVVEEYWGGAKACSYLLTAKPKNSVTIAADPFNVMVLSVTCCCCCPVIVAAVAGRADDASVRLTSVDSSTGRAAKRGGE